MEKLAIIDLGGQYTKVIDRRVRELGVYTDIFAASVRAEELGDYGALILSGGPQSVWEEGALGCDAGLLALGVPILGICYGMHWLNVALGGTISPVIKKEYGQVDIRVEATCPLFDGLSETQTVLMSHGDSVEALAPGLVANAWSGDLIVGFGDPEKRIYGMQFHPEVDLTANGQDMLRNFLRKVTCFTETYALEDRIENAVREIRQQVGDHQVLVLVSGGVDSAVSAALLLRALDPEKVFAIHVDHGLMRLNESAIICEKLEELGLRHLILENAQELFFNTTIELDGRTIGPLTTLTDPEDKRQLIGTLFLTAMRSAAEKLDVDFDNAYWAQGTLRPDLIESGNPDVSKSAQRIKTHHNDVDLVRKAREAGRVVETNRDWHKDEVRKVAAMLGLGEEIAQRQPFPGPGLGVRVQCQTAFDEIPASVQATLDGILQGTPFSGKVLPIRSVGVQGDARSFRNLTVLWGQGIAADGRALSALARTITNQIHTVNRVAYVLNREEITDIACHPMTISAQNVDLLRHVDAPVTRALTAKPISQSFAVLVPLGEVQPCSDELPSSDAPYTSDAPHTSDAPRASVALRAFVTNDFMTGRAALLGEEIVPDVLAPLVAEIERDYGDQIDLILYDITDKPPATCEWQ
jgi:GMP synthase (glutamine-hydrolysing)